MKLLNSKKGFNITEVPTLAVVLLVIAIILGIGSTILTQVRDTDSMTTTSSAVDTNSTFTVSNVTAVTFGTELDYQTDGRALLVANTCSNVFIIKDGVDKTANFTIVGCTALLKSPSGSHGDGMTANFTYSYNQYLMGYNVTTAGLDAQNDLSDWQGTWVVIVAAAVVLGIVGRYLFFK